MSKHPQWDAVLAEEIVHRLGTLDGAMLPILHELQHTFGYVDAAIVPEIADTLNLSKAEVVGTISFYHEFRQTPPGAKVIKLCRAEACQAVGCEDLVGHLSHKHGMAMDATTGDITVETVYCLGNCALGPAMLVDGTLTGRVDAAMLDAEIAR